jgi:hypothetical protein
VGKDNLLYFFRGQIRSVRISEGERYGDQFESVAELDSDESTLLMVASPRLDGSLILEANGNPVGQIERLGSR